MENHQIPSDLLENELALFDEHCDYDNTPVTSKSYKKLEDDVKIYEAKERVNASLEKNIKLKLKPVPFKEKVEKWLRTFSVGQSSKHLRCSMETVIDDQIEETESLQSVDTERYIKSNRRRTTTKAAMTTIKKYCFSKKERQNHRSTNGIGCEKNQNPIGNGTTDNNLETSNVGKDVKVCTRSVKRKHQTSITHHDKSIRKTQSKVFRRRYQRRNQPPSSTNEADNENMLSLQSAVTSKIDNIDVDIDINPTLYDPISDVPKSSKKFKQIRKRPRKKRKQQSIREPETTSVDAEVDAELSGIEVPNISEFKASEVLSLNKKCFITATDRTNSDGEIEAIILSSCNEFLNVFPIYK